MAMFDQVAREGYRNLSRPFTGGGESSARGSTGASMATPYLTSADTGAPRSGQGRQPTAQGGYRPGDGGGGWSWGNWDQSGLWAGPGRRVGQNPPIPQSPSAVAGPPGMPTRSPVGSPWQTPEGGQTPPWGPRPGAQTTRPDSTVGLPPLTPPGPPDPNRPWVIPWPPPGTQPTVPPEGGVIPEPPPQSTGTMYPPGQSPFELWEARYGEAWRRQRMATGVPDKSIVGGQTPPWGVVTPPPGVGGMTPPYVPPLSTQPGGVPPGGLPADVNTRRWAAGLPPLEGYPGAPGARGVGGGGLPPGTPPWATPETPWGWGDRRMAGLY